MKSNIQRINNIIGQLEGIKKLLEDNSGDCLKALTQIKAVKSATGALMEKVIETEFESCCSCSGVEPGQLKKIFAEITKN